MPARLTYCGEPFAVHPSREVVEQDLRMVLQRRNLQSLVEIGVDKNTTVVFPAPLMSTIGELGTFLAREAAAATPRASTPAVAPLPAKAVTANGDAAVRADLNS